MDSQFSQHKLLGTYFKTALTIFEKSDQTQSLSTGSSELDRLINKLEVGKFHLFYSSNGGDVSDRLLHRLLVEAVRDANKRAVYLVCGNYRRSRTVLDSEYLISLIEAEGLDLHDALSRIYIVCAFSERQQIRAPSLIKSLLEKYSGFTLVAAQQVTKIFYGKHAIRHESPAEFTGMISRLKSLCSGTGTVLVATCQQSTQAKSIPLPEGGSFLRHTANTIVYLRMSPNGALSAHVVKHPKKKLIGRRVNFDQGENVLWVG